MTMEREHCREEQQMWEEEMARSTREFEAARLSATFAGVSDAPVKALEILRAETTALIQASRELHAASRGLGPLTGQSEEFRDSGLRRQRVRATALRAAQLVAAARRVQQQAQSMRVLAREARGAA